MFVRKLDETCFFFKIFNKKSCYIDDFSLHRLITSVITSVLNALVCLNLLCVLTPVMQNLLPNVCLKNRRKLFMFYNFFKKTFKYFFDRAQIPFGGTYSHICSVRYSVRMGPYVLFILYNNDMQSVIDKKCSMAQFADDALQYMPGKKHSSIT